MVDFKFNWQEELEVDFPDINEQHKELFRIGRDMEQLLLRHCIGVQTSELLEIVGDLRNFVSYHFYFEEEIMLAAGYEDFENHKKGHDDFLNKINSIDLPFLASNPYIGINKIRDDLVDYVFQHMMCDDVKMVDAVIKKAE